MNSQIAALHPAEDLYMSVAGLEDLEPGNYIPLWLGSDTRRQNALDGLVAGWGMRRPFYIRQNGILSVMCGRERDVREVYMYPERFTVEPPKRPGYELFDMFGGLESVLQMDGPRHNRVRRLMNPSFNQASRELLKADSLRIIQEKLDRIEKIGPEFDAMTDYAEDLVSRVMLEASFRLSPEHCAAFVTMQREMGKLPSYVAGRRCRSPRAPPTGTRRCPRRGRVRHRSVAADQFRLRRRPESLSRHTGGEKRDEVDAQRNPRSHAESPARSACVGAADRERATPQAARHPCRPGSVRGG